MQSLQVGDLILAQARHFTTAWLATKAYQAGSWSTLGPGCRPAGGRADLPPVYAHLRPGLFRAWCSSSKKCPILDALRYGAQHAAGDQEPAAEGNLSSARS